MYISNHRKLNYFPSVFHKTLGPPYSRDFFFDASWQNKARMSVCVHVYTRVLLQETTSLNNNHNKSTKAETQQESLRNYSMEGQRNGQLLAGVGIA